MRKTIRAPLSERELHKTLARRHRRGSLPKSLWREVRGSTHLELALKGDRRALELLSDLVGYGLYQRSRRKRGTPSPPSPDRLLGWQSADEQRRGEVLASYYARLAMRYGRLDLEDAQTGEVLRGRSKVEAFREKSLEGRVLGAVEAEQLVRSPTTAILPAETLRGIPLSERTATRVEHVQVVDESGRVEETFRLEFVGDGERHTLGRSFSPPAHSANLEFLSAAGESTVRVYPDSLLDELRVLSEDLSKRYGWRRSEATWFVLTGRTPDIHGVFARPTYMWTDDHTHAAIQMTIQPWVTTRSVARAYKDLQTILFRQIQGDPEGQPQVHPTKRKSLDFFDFVSERLMGGSSYRVTMLAWNRKHPGAESYGANGDENFYRDYMLLHERLIRLKWPKRNPAPKKRNKR